MYVHIHVLWTHTIIKNFIYPQLKQSSKYACIILNFAQTLFHIYLLFSYNVSTYISICMCIYIHIHSLRLLSFKLK